MANADPHCHHQDGPYTKEVENGIRLSALLINEGTKAVRTKFLEKIKEKKFASLIQVLNTQNVKRTLDSYHKGIGGRPKLLNDAQFKLLFPQKGTPNILEFDLTLLTFLFRNVFNEKPPPTTGNWRDEPAKHDYILSADLVRLRLMRNSLYGHITHMNLSDCVYQQSFQQLEAILLRLNCKPQDIISWKTKPLSNTAEQQYHSQITQLLENDLADIHALLNVVNKLPLEIKSVLKEHSAAMEDVFQKTSQSTKLSFTDIEFMMANVLEALSQVPFDVTVNVMNKMNSDNKEIVSVLTEVKEGQKRQQNIITEHQIRQTKHIQEIVETHQITQKSIEYIKGVVSSESTDIKNRMEDQSSEIRNNIKKLCEEMKRTNESDCTSVSEIKDILHEHQDAFKILLYNKPDALNGDNAHLKKEFGFALGSVPWDIIIDLDNDSRTESGMFDKIALVLGKQKDYKVATYAEMYKFVEEDKDIVEKGMKTLWLLANGCSQIGCEPSEKQFGIAITEIYPLLKTTINRLQRVRPLIFINLILGNTTRKPISRLIQAFADICESTHDRIDFEKSVVMSLCFENEHMVLLPNIDDEINHIKNSISPAQFLYVLSECYPSNDSELKYYFPGDKTLCSMSADEIARLRPYAELYHINIGEITFEDKNTNEIDVQIEEIRLNFLKGNVLTPEAMHINDSCQVLVVRKEMKKISDIIEKSLERKEDWVKSKGAHFEIVHDASGSGTTTAIYALYNLRKRYPCLMVKRIEETTISLLKKISKDSRKPLLLMVDSSDYRVSDLNSLQYRLENEQIKCLVVHVRRLLLADLELKRQNKSSVTDTKCYISSNLENEHDKLAFRKLYDTVRSHIKADRVYLFGLIAFCEDYERLNIHINACFQNMKKNEQDVLSLIFYTWKFCHSAVNTRLLCHLSESSKKNPQVDLLLGYGIDLVLCNKSESSVRPAHQCLIDPYHKILEKKQGAVNVMTTFMDNLYKMFSATKSSKEDSSQICYELFLQRENSMVDFFSPLITAMGKICGKEFVAEQIQRFMKIYEQYQGTTVLKAEHLRGLYARYLMYCMNKPEDAIEQIVVAVGLQTSQSINVTGITKVGATLVSIYAGLFRQYANQIFQKFKDNGADIALMECLGYFEESVRAYSLAQQVTKSINYPLMGNNQVSKYTPVPFLGEAKARHTVLNLCFLHICKGNHEAFVKFIEKTDSLFIKECEQEAIETLEKLERLILLNKLQDDEPLTTKRLMTEMKFKLLFLRFDKNMSVTKLMKTISKDVSCDIGMLVRGCASTIDYKQGTFNKRPWEDLTSDQLQLIADTILKRIAHKTMISSNYLDCITAMIHLRQVKGPGKYRQYNIDLALQLAREWVKASNNDVNATFTLGSLLLAKGIDENSHHIVKEATENLTGCNEMCLNNPSARSMRTIKYLISGASGLEKVLPVKYSHSGKGSLHVFYGRMIDRKYVAVQPFKGVLRASVTRNLQTAEDDQRPLLKFNISLRMLDPILATNVERVPKDEIVNDFQGN